MSGRLVSLGLAGWLSAIVVAGSVAPAGANVEPVLAAAPSRAVPLAKAAVDGSSDEPLAVASPALAVGQGLVGGGPANLQLLTSVVLSRLGLLPPGAGAVLFDFYARGVDAVTAGAAVATRFLVQSDTAARGLSPLVNPPVQAVGGAAVGAAAAGLEALGGLGAVGGQRSSFPVWLAKAVRQIGATSRVTPPS